MNRSRQGWTLMELLVVISVSSLITGFAVTLLATLFQYNQKTARLSNETVSLSRLSDQYRADVRAATSIDHEQQETDGEIALTLAENSRVVYRQQGDLLLRILYQDEKPGRQESYLLPMETRVTLHEAPSEMGQMATLMLDYPIRPELESKHRNRLITAALGRDLGWASGNQGNQP